MNKPLNVDDELFGELRMLYKRRISSNLSLADYLLEMRQLILADRKKHELQARIDELSAIYGWSQEERTPLIFYPEHRSSDFAQMAANGMGTNFTVRERIAELEQQLIQGEKP